MFEQHCFQYHQSIISSKILLKPYSSFPKIKKIVVFFILNTKYYKKNSLLFYIIVNLCFYRTNASYKQEVNNYQVLKFSLQKRKIAEFFNSFITVYLPVLDFNQNLIKKSALNNNRKSSSFLYRICYSNFPVIPESDFLCYTNEYIYNWISGYQIRFDMYLKSMYFVKNSLGFLFRLRRFPISTKFIYKQ